ncbi:MAG: hypothetical protein LC624_02835 [Halobacteriales archaeon]|nr:hypothetical protein [Halobacteriales archaeon]
MDASGFLWLRKPGFALGALLARDAEVPPPLEAQQAPWGTLLWLPLAREAHARKALAGVRPELLLYPATKEQVPAVVDAWLWLYEQAPKGIDEAMLQVTDDPAFLHDYLAAEEALWERIYEAHPHREDEGILPGALEEARWLVHTVLDAPGYEQHTEFLTMSAFEVVARELLVTVRRAELLHLRDALQGKDTVSGW